VFSRTDGIAAFHSLDRHDDLYLAARGNVATASVAEGEHQKQYAKKKRKLGTGITLSRRPADDFAPGIELALENWTER